MKIRFYIVLVVCVALCFGCVGGKKSGQAKKEEPVTYVEGLNFGNKAPEIEQLDPAGQPIKLSSLKGKIVLIDFWASWCRPCRDENPNVVAVHEKYKDQKLKNGNGFTVYSVSMDTNKEAWQMAIANDKLMWPTHVSELNGWNNSAASKFGVVGIPTNYLIDGNGIIIGKALRGADLENALEKLIIKQ